jgi:hypothetical protein
MVVIETTRLYRVQIVSRCVHGRVKIVKSGRNSSGSTLGWCAVTHLKIALPSGKELEFEPRTS